MTRIHEVEISSRGPSAYLYFEPPAAEASAKQINLGDAMILDFASDGRLIGMEILLPEVAARFQDAEARRALEAQQIPVTVQDG